MQPMDLRGMQDAAEAAEAQLQTTRQALAAAQAYLSSLRKIPDAKLTEQAWALPPETHATHAHAASTAQPHRLSVVDLAEALQGDAAAMVHAVLPNDRLGPAVPLEVVLRQHPALWQALQQVRQAHAAEGSCRDAAEDALMKVSPPCTSICASRFDGCLCAM